MGACRIHKVVVLGHLLKAHAGKHKADVGAEDRDLTHSYPVHPCSPSPRQRAYVRVERTIYHLEDDPWRRRLRLEQRDVFRAVASTPCCRIKANQPGHPHLIVPPPAMPPLIHLAIVRRTIYRLA